MTSLIDLENAPLLVFDDNLTARGNSFVFHQPKRVIVCTEPETVDRAFDDLETALAQDFWVAGFFSYELGYLFEPKLQNLLPGGREQPLMWFGVFDQPQVLTTSQCDALFAGEIEGSSFSLSDLTLGLNEEAFTQRFDIIKAYIEAGDIYQANFTFPVTFDYEGTPPALYHALRAAQPVTYGAFMNLGDDVLMSRSPELFVKIDGDKITARPMKGTAKRAPSFADDQEIAARLARDPKQQAENLMILDLLRNDLARVSEPGSVHVPSIFDVETFRTVHQMTSTVEARLKQSQPWRDIIGSLFPCGSITGAPKVRAMEILREMEDMPRGVYTGAMGMIAPNGDASFNVAIRTLALTRQDDMTWRGRAGVGGGIVADSTAEDEYEECRTKLQFLNAVQDPHVHNNFQLIETMRWQPDTGFALFDKHLQRLSASAQYFDFPCKVSMAREVLEEAVIACGDVPQRVRLLLSDDGEISVTISPLPDNQSVSWCFCVSERTTHSDNVFLYHKTTNRQFYDQERIELNRLTGCDEVLFVNERGEVTEGSLSNVFLEREGRLLTPALHCGLLNGILRQHLLETNQVREAVLTLEDLGQGKVYFGNSVRGLVPTLLVAAP